MGADNAWPHQQQGASLVRVLRSCQLVMQLHWLVEFGGLNKLKGVEHHARHIMRNGSLQRLAAFFLIGILEDGAQLSAFRAGVGGVDQAVDGAVGRKGERSFAHGSVGVGRQNGQGDDLAGRAGREGSVAALQIGAQIAHGGAFIRRIEDQVLLAINGLSPSP